MVTAHEADLLSMRNILDEITKKKYGHFREQREEQVVLPSVVRRVLVVGRTS